MSMFNRNNSRQAPVFMSRAEAFDYMFAEMCDRGADLTDAAKKANEFAEIIAKNRLLPDAPAKQKNIIETCTEYLQQISVIKKDHPEIWDLAAGAIGGLIGAFASTKSNNNDKADGVPPPPPDFTNID